MVLGDFVACDGGEKIWGRRFGWLRGHALLYVNGAEASEFSLLLIYEAPSVLA
jgi:hypothetical protein